MLVSGDRWLAAARHEWLVHGFSTRIGGVSEAYLAGDPEVRSAPSVSGRTGPNAGELNLGFTVDDVQANVVENRRRFLNGVVAGAMDGNEMRLATVRQVHSNRTVVIESRKIILSALGTVMEGPGDERSPVEADGMLTADSGLLLGMLTADCVPVLVADTRKRVVGAFHAGWRGTEARIVEFGIEKMCADFGSGPEDLIAAIGPAIGPCCYQVGGEVVKRFQANFAYAEALFAEAGPGIDRLDLVEANRRQLLAAGLRAEAVERVGGCTCCRQELYFSHRGSGGRAGRMMAVIGVRGPGSS